MRANHLATVAFAKVVLAFCAPALADDAPPGLSSLFGWGNRYNPDWGADTPAINGFAVDKDIDGKVGYPLHVNGPSAVCRPAGGFTGYPSVVKGVLPPGLNFQGGEIKGIPTERGNWIVTVALSGITCNGSAYKGYERFEQQLRFHITGSGVVIQ